MRVTGVRGLGPHGPRLRAELDRDPDSAKPERMETLQLERYKIAYAEYRAEVSLGNERQKLFITLNPVIAALASSTHIKLASAALLLAASASIVGIVLVGRSHGRYQRTRDVLLALAKQLGCESDWQTTGGMREARSEPRWEGPRVTTAVKALLGLYAIFDVVVLGLLW